MNEASWIAPSSMKVPNLALTSGNGGTMKKVLKQSTDPSNDIFGRP